MNRSLLRIARVAATLLLAWAGAAHAQNFAGEWELTNPQGTGKAAGRMTISADGSIDFDDVKGSWQAGGGHLTARIYGSERLRAANMPAADVEFRFNGGSDRLVGSLHNLINGQTTPFGARRVGAVAAAEPLGGGGDAKGCIRITRVTEDGSTFHKITNACNQKIGVNYCHEPSGMPGTRGTQCGEKGRYYQQFTTLEPGASTGNNFSTPADSQVRYGACFGGEGKIRQASGGEYTCR